MKKKIIKIILFLLCLFAIGYILNELLKYKSNDGIDQMQAFYKNEANTIDVLFMGSSHSYSNVNTGVLYKDFGIAAYDLGGAEQLLWNNYYWLVEALKTQRPKVVVLELFSTGVIKDDFQGAWMMENIYGMNFSENYYDSVKTSTLDSAFDSYILPFTRYHSKYNQITKTDFTYEKYLDTFKGFEPKWGQNGTSELIEPDIRSVTEMTPISEKAERYYRKYIELCKQENIPLVFVCSPYMVTEDAQKIYNYMFSIADEYEIPYLDFNKMYEELGLDFTKDMCEWSHLNEKGNVKYTTYLGNYLKKNYDLPDRRSDKKYWTWKIDADTWVQEYNLHTFPNVKKAENYLKALNNPYYTIIVNINEGNDYSSMAEEITQELTAIGIDEQALTNKVTVLRKGELLFTSNEEEYEWYTSFDNGDIIVKRVLSSEEENENEIQSQVQINGAIHDTQGYPVVITIYDNLLNSRVSTIGLSPEDGYTVIK